MNTPERFEVGDGGSVLTTTWDDGRRTQLTARTLRAACPCATCGEPAGWSAMQRVVEGETDVTIDGAHLVGSYALGLTFAPDGHRTGIFPFDLIESLGASYDDPTDPEGPS
ncbi:MAG TPA: DUF971 domain-containing protein [Acidimicrobiia bacterium]|nr:DUF971 domain-containing protein [Acidimicrobiia bacterium]